MSVSIRNLTKQLLRLNRIGREIEPEATIEVSEEDAAKLAGHPLLDGVPPAPEPTPEPVAVAVKPAPKKSTPNTPTQEDGEQK